MFAYNAMRKCVRTLTRVIAIASLGAGLSISARGASQEIQDESEAALNLYVNSPDPASTPSLGAVRLYGNAETTTRVLYGVIQGEATRPVDGDEDGELTVSVAANGASAEIARVTSAGLTVNGVLTASAGFSGSGANLSNVNADTLDGQDGSYYASASSLGAYAKLDSTNQPFSGYVGATDFRISGSTVLRASGTDNVMLGAGAGSNNTGTGNVLEGKNAAAGNSGANNVVVGRNAGYSKGSGDANVLVGAYAGYSATAPSYSVMIGSSAGYNCSGDNCVIIGGRAGYNATTAQGLTFLGKYAGYNSTSGNYNTFLGYSTGYSNGTGASNTYVGYSTGDDNAGSYNTFIGSNADRAYTSVSNSIAIGYVAKSTANHQAVIGSDGENGYVSNVFLGSGVERYSPYSVTVHATNATSTSTNNGAHLRLVGGAKGTGSSTDGDVYLAYDGVNRVGNVRIPSLVILHDVTTTKSVGSNEAHLYCYNGRLYCVDAYGNKTLNSPHQFALYQPAPDDPLPWTYYSENRFIGKRVNADVSGALRDLEKITKKQYIHVEDLPKEETQNWEQWRDEEVNRLIDEALQRELVANPNIEISAAEALEEVPETEDVQVEKTVTRYRMNFDTGAVEPYQATVTVMEKRQTGRTIKQFKAGCWLDETTGKCYRPRTLEDIRPEDLPPISEIEAPMWLQERMR